MHSPNILHTCLAHGRLQEFKEIKEQKESIWTVQNYIDILSQKTARKV